VLTALWTAPGAAWTIPLPLAGAEVAAAAVEEDDPADATTGPTTAAGAAVLVPLAVLWLAGVDATGAAHAAAAAGPVAAGAADAGAAAAGPVAAGATTAGAGAATADAEPPWAGGTDTTWDTTLATGWVTTATEPAAQAPVAPD
jgi:hypothetical protein